MEALGSTCATGAEGLGVSTLQLECLLPSSLPFSPGDSPLATRGSREDT